jgi:hypothetical protein
VLGGGETLNSMIQQSVRSGDAGATIQSAFRKRAEELLRMGAAGFGEMAAEHLRELLLANLHRRTIRCSSCLPT